MKNLLRLEELAQFLVCLALLNLMDGPWWQYLLLILGPDIGMLGYLVSPKVGAISYNILHHKGMALLLVVIGLAFGFTLYPPFGMLPVEAGWFMAGIILYGHASLDSIFGYGLKFGDSFHHTHLGWIGKAKGKEQ